MKLPPESTLSAESLRPVDFFFRDFSAERPVGDDVFRAFASLYSYDHGDLAPGAVVVDDSPRDWRI